MGEASEHFLLRRLGEVGSFSIKHGVAEALNLCGEELDSILLALDILVTFHERPGAIFHVDHVDVALVSEDTRVFGTSSGEGQSIKSSGVVAINEFLGLGRSHLLDGLPDFLDGLFINIDVESSSELHEVGRDHGHEDLHEHWVGLFSFFTGQHLDEGLNETIPDGNALSDGETLHGKTKGVLTTSNTGEDFLRGSSHLELELSGLVSRDLGDEVCSEGGENWRSRATSAESVATINELALEGDGSHGLDLVEEGNETSLTEPSVGVSSLHLKRGLNVDVGGVFVHVLVGV